MFGFGLPELLILFGLPIFVTICLTLAKNPYEKGTDEYQALRLSRIGLAFAVWSFGFGLFGIALAIVAFVFGIIGIIKGRTLYGILVIVLSIMLPPLGLLWNLASFGIFRH